MVNYIVTGVIAVIVVCVLIVVGCNCAKNPVTIAQDEYALAWKHYNDNPTQYNYVEKERASKELQRVIEEEARSHPTRHQY